MKKVLLTEVFNLNESADYVSPVEVDSADAQYREEELDDLFKKAGWERDRPQYTSMGGNYAFNYWDKKHWKESPKGMLKLNSVRLEPISDAAKKAMANLDAEEKRSSYHDPEYYEDGDPYELWMLRNSLNLPHHFVQDKEVPKILGIDEKEWKSFFNGY